MGLFDWLSRKMSKPANRAASRHRAFDFRHIMVFRQGPVPPHGTPCTQAEAVEAIKALVKSPNASPVIKLEPVQVDASASTPLQEFASVLLADGAIPCAMTFGGIDNPNDLNIFEYARRTGPEKNDIHLYNSHFGGNTYKICLFCERVLQSERTVTRPLPVEQVHAVMIKVGSNTFPQHELASVMRRFLNSASFDDAPTITRWRNDNRSMCVKAGCIPFIAGMQLVAFGGGDYGQQFIVDLKSFKIADPEQQAVFGKMMRKDFSLPAGPIELFQAVLPPLEMELSFGWVSIT